MAKPDPDTRMAVPGGPVYADSAMCGAPGAAAPGWYGAATASASVTGAAAAPCFGDWRGGGQAETGHGRGS